jgi:hypothetical protein
MREKDGLSSARPGAHFAAKAPQLYAGVIIAKWLNFKARQLPFFILSKWRVFYFTLLLRYLVKIP